MWVSMECLPRHLRVTGMPPSWSVRAVQWDLLVALATRGAILFLHTGIALKVSLNDTRGEAGWR